MIKIHNHSGWSFSSAQIDYLITLHTSAYRPNDSQFLIHCSTYPMLHITVVSCFNSSLAAKDTSLKYSTQWHLVRKKQMSSHILTSSMIYNCLSSGITTLVRKEAHHSVALLFGAAIILFGSWEGPDKKSWGWFHLYSYSW
jgi:hypothetical protein